MNLGLIFISLAAISGTIYGVFQKKASTGIHPMWGLSLTSLVALVIGLAGIFFLKLQGKETLFTTKGAVYIILVGISAAAINVFYLLGYSLGAPLGVSAVVSTAVGTIAAVLLGIVLFGEGISLIKAVGFFLIILGALVLQIK